MCRSEGWGGGWLVAKRGGWVFSQWGRWWKISVHNSSNRFLKTLTEGAVTTKACSLFQYFTTLTENADHLVEVHHFKPQRNGFAKNGFTILNINLLDNRESYTAQWLRSSCPLIWGHLDLIGTGYGKTKHIQIDSNVQYPWKETSLFLKYNAMYASYRDHVSTSLVYSFSYSSGYN